MSAAVTGAVDSERVTRPAHRPSKYKVEFCERVVDLGCEGKSKVEIAFDLGVGTTTLQRWEAEHAEFRVAMAHAKEAEQVWWERKGRTNLSTQGFQASMWSRSMAARFPEHWRETSRQEQTGINGKPIETTTKIEWVLVEPTPLMPKPDAKG